MNIDILLLKYYHVLTYKLLMLGGAEENPEIDEELKDIELAIWKQMRIINIEKAKEILLAFSRRPIHEDLVESVLKQLIQDGRSIIKGSVEKSVPTEEKVLPKEEPQEILEETDEEKVIVVNTDDVALLEKAKEDKVKRKVIFRKLKVNDMVYTEFVFDRVFMKRDVSAKEVMHDLRLASDNIMLLGTFMFSTGAEKYNIHKTLKTKGFNFFDEFVQENNMIG